MLDINKDYIQVADGVFISVKEISTVPEIQYTTILTTLNRLFPKPNYESFWKKFEESNENG